jgi:hypothetical protein
LAATPFALDPDVLIDDGAIRLGPRPLEGSIFDEFAQVVEALHPIDARTLDHYEIWEIAAALGRNRPPDERVALTGDAGYMVSSDWNVKRALAIEAGEPEPAWPDTPFPDELL